MAAPFVFKCTAKDGRTVRLERDRYDGHVLSDHPDLGVDYLSPANEIQRALEQADKIQPGNTGQRLHYVGPPATPNSLSATFGSPRKARRFHVIVQIEPANCGHVVTAYSTTV